MSRTFDAAEGRKNDLVAPSATTGLVVGTAVGLAAGHLGIWIACGLALGLVAGYVLTSLRGHRH